MSLAIDQFIGGGQFDSARIDQWMEGRSFPIVEGRHITFVYRGDADEVKMQHFIFGLATSQSFQRIGDSDLWVFKMEVPHCSRFEYKFNVRTGETTNWIRDPLNPFEARDPFGSNSVCHGEGYETPEWTQVDSETRPGTLHHLRVKSKAMECSHDVQIYLPARYRKTRRYPLLIVHDGPDYLRYSAFKTVLDNLIHRQEVAPLIVALTHSDNRLQAYAGDERHSRYIATELLPLLEGRLPLQKVADGRCLMGASFGAVAALHTAWTHQGVFGKLLLQSGSYAFSDIGPHKRAEVFDPVAKFINALRENPGRPSDKVYISCGVYESLIYENRSIVPLLQSTGMSVKFREAKDGHNWENWRDRMREGLSWLFPGSLWMVYE